MTAGLMRRLLPSRQLRAEYLVASSRPSIAGATIPKVSIEAAQQPLRALANVRDIQHDLPEVEFSSSVPLGAPEQIQKSDGKPPDERTVKIGKTIRVLQERLPTLLANPLPQEILSPQITLHLFPSTHPHLPKVSGRIGYIAALWTAPVAWGRVPVVGNVKLKILSERMVKNGAPCNKRSGNEKLIVRWKTCGKSKSRDLSAAEQSSTSQPAQVDKITEFLGVPQDDKEFCGLFIFEFDEEGRVLTHIIEHAEEGHNFDKMTRVVSVTDWLLGKVNGKNNEGVPSLAFCEREHRVNPLRGHHERRHNDPY